MAKTRRTKCALCGCERVLIIKGASLKEQHKDGRSIEFGIKPLCIPCFLSELKIDMRLIKEANEELYDEFMLDVDLEFRREQEENNGG